MLFAIMIRRDYRMRATVAQRPLGEVGHKENRMRIE